jgi:hypothetical protein
VAVGAAAGAAVVAPATTGVAEEAVEEEPVALEAGAA